MLRAGHSLRFTPTEIEELRRVGIDVDGARTQDDLDQALARWAGTLAEDDEADEIVDAGDVGMTDDALATDAEYLNDAE